MLGDRLLTSEAFGNDINYCMNNKTSGPIFELWCPGDENGTRTCDPYFLDNDVKKVPGIPGLTSGHFTSMLNTMFFNVLILSI